MYSSSSTLDEFWIFRFPNTYTLIHVAATFDKASNVAIEMAIKAQRTVSKG